MKGGNIRQNFYFYVELEVDNLLVCTEILILTNRSRELGALVDII
jgi:hypothetical protein